MLFWLCMHHECTIFVCITCFIWSNKHIPTTMLVSDKNMLFKIFFLIIRLYVFKKQLRSTCLDCYSAIKSWNLKKEKECSKRKKRIKANLEQTKTGGRCTYSNLHITPMSVCASLKQTCNPLSQVTYVYKLWQGPKKSDFIWILCRGLEINIFQWR